MPPIVDRHKKQTSKMERTLHLRGYDKSTRALDYVRGLESDLTRKDGETPGFHHQLSVARLVYTLEPHLLFPEETLTACFLHDVMEDHDISGSNLRHVYGDLVAGTVWKLTKAWKGRMKPPGEYFAEIALCPIASIVKLADRAHNIQTMTGVFNHEKQMDYVEEVRLRFFPLIREARRNHPQQYDAYENLKILIRSQTALLRRTLEAEAP